MTLKGVFTTLLLSAVAIALTVTTVILAPLPMMLLRRNLGRLSLLACGILGVATLYWVASPAVLLTYVASFVLTLVYGECESQNIGYSSSVFVTLMIVLGFTAICLGISIQHFGFEPESYFRAQINEALGQVTFPAGVSIDKEALVYQVPSVFVIVMIVAIWLNSILAGRFEVALQWLPRNHIYTSADFRKWSLPDTFVWIALLSTVGSFFDIKPLWLHWVAANVFNICVLLYFFQGLAIIVDFFAVKRVSTLWRFVAYLFIFSQLFLMVSFLGFVDLWMGFRNRIKPNTSAVA